MTEAQARAARLAQAVGITTTHGSSTPSGSRSPSRAEIRASLEKTVRGLAAGSARADADGQQRFGIVDAVLAAKTTTQSRTTEPPTRVKPVKAVRSFHVRLTGGSAFGDQASVTSSGTVSLATGDQVCWKLEPVHGIGKVLSDGLFARSSSGWTPEMLFNDPWTGCEALTSTMYRALAKAAPDLWVVVQDVAHPAGGIGGRL